MTRWLLEEGQNLPYNWRNKKKWKLADLKNYNTIELFSVYLIL